MKVRVIQKPTYQYGGARYDPLQYSVQDVLGMGVGTLQTGLGINNIIQSSRPDKKQNPTPAQTGTSPLLSDWKGFNNNPTINSGILSDYKGLGFHQEGGEAKPTDPQLLAAYKSIAASLEQGNDPYSVIDEFVNTGMAQDDAQALVAQVMEYLNPTAEASMPQAQMGGTQSGMNAGMFAGQSQGAYVVKKPLMKDGGQTFVTSQPAYTKKSHTYFGTSNAPARDSYTDNNQVTTSVKAVPREDATIEAEKGEYIFSEGGLYKIEGKKHYEGGTPLAAKGGEFIFSAHRDMSLDPKLLKEAGLKVSPSKALADHVPAKVLERNIDVKEYNRLKTILSNPKSDPVTKKTAQFMLDKMHNKIDVIAKLQEGKKQPKPVEVEDQYLEQSEVDKDINEQKQYAYGGLTEYQVGTDTTGVKVDDVNFSGTNPMQDLNRIVRIVDKSGNQELLDLMNPEHLKKYSQMYLYLGNGTFEGNDNNTGAAVYTYPLLDDVQPDRAKTYNLPTVEVKGAIDPRWADFVANNQEYLAMMTPPEKEQMKKIVLGDASQGYFDRATSMQPSRLGHPERVDPRAQIDYEKLIPFYGRKSEGFGDWLGTLWSGPQKVLNSTLTGYYETPAETANRLHVKDKDWEKKGFWTNLATDPMLAESVGTIGKGLLKMAAPETFGKIITAAEKKALVETADEAAKKAAIIGEREAAPALRVRQVNKTIKSLEEQLLKETDKKTIEYLTAQKASLENWKALYESQKNWAKEATKAAKKAAVQADKPNYSKYIGIPGSQRAATTYLYEPAGKGLGTAAAYVPYLLNMEILNKIGRGIYNIATHPAASQLVFPGLNTIGTVSRHSSDEERNKAILNNYLQTRANIMNKQQSGVSDPSGNISTSDTTQVAGPTSAPVEAAAPVVQQAAPVASPPPAPVPQYHPTAPTQERVYTRTASYYEPSTGKYENTDFDQHGKILKEYSTDYKVGTTQSPNYKKAYGGLNQYQIGTKNAQPTYFNDPTTGLRVGTNKQGVPGLYRGDKSIFDVYYNPKDITATGKGASFKGGVEDLNNIVKSMSEAGVDFSNVNTGADFQRSMWDWRLKNNPDALERMMGSTGATNNMMKYPKLRGQLEQLGLKTEDSDTNYTMNFSGMTPENRNKALRLMGDYFPDNYVGVRSIGAYNKPTIPGKIPTIELPKPEIPRIKPLDMDEVAPPSIPPPNIPTTPPSIPIDGGDFDIQDPYEKVGAWQTAQYFNAMRKPRFTYTPPIEQPNTIFTPMSRQPFEDEAGRARYSANQLASKFGDMTGRQMAAAQQNEQINKGLFGVEKYNTEGYNQNFNENLLRNAAKVNQFNQMAKTVHDQNNLAQDKTDEANAFAFNQYAAARQKDLLNRYYADRDLQTAMLPYASTYDTVDANGRPTRRVAYPVYPGGRFNPNWNGWNTNATNQLAGGNDVNKLLTEIDNSGLPADKKLELKIKALRGDK